MSATLSFKDRLLAILVPTAGQAIWAVIFSLAIVVTSQSRVILANIGVSSGALHSVSDQFHARFDGILRSEITSQLAVITFWAVVGLVAYLLCWGAYNVLVEARNEVTLNTVYTNRGHWKGPYHTLGLKVFSAIGFGLLLASVVPGFSIWMSWFAHFVNSPGVLTSVMAVVAIFGSALHLYLVLAFAQLTFTPWYRPGAFTED